MTYQNDKKLRVIRTARSVEAINEGAKLGFNPLVKPVRASPQIQSKFAVLQNKNTGEIQVISDYRNMLQNDPEFETVIDFTFYYPHHFKSPFAAYLVPKGLATGEHVWLEDLIDDIVATTWNQGDGYRLNSCEAVWDGKDFIIQYSANNKQPQIIG